MQLAKNKYLRLMRFDKPVGTLLTLLPALWALVLSAATLFEALIYMPVFILGAFLVRSAGCVINDIFDRKFDAKVQRTKQRPLASGEVSVTEAINLAVILLLMASALLYFLPIKAIIFAVIAVIMLAFYPLLKRFTFYPQVFLGLVFNLGTLIAWYSVSQGGGVFAAILYLGCVAWTVGYDTIYAYQDIEDDKKAGVKSLAIKWEKDAKKNIWHSYQFFLFCLAIVGLSSGMNLLYFALLAMTAYHLYWQKSTLKIDSSQDCARKFRSNAEVGTLILVACFVGRIQF